MSTDAVYDDLFVYSPSFLAGQPLTEGKAIGTAKHQDLVLVQHMLKHPTDPSNYAKEVKSGAAMGKAKLEQVQERARKALISAIGLFSGGKIDEAELRKRAVKTMKTAWRDVFLAGIVSSGVPGTAIGEGKLAVSLDPLDEKWLRSATQHEMRFLNGFLSDIVEDKVSMPLVTRTMMYVKALRSFFESARVIGLPATVLIHWVGPHDSRSCAGCKYLFENGPYSKFTLPTTPAAGMTSCLSNCRDRLLVRRVTLKEVTEAVASAGRSREAMVRDLRVMKRTGKPLA